jgi:hypothetical protein
MASDNEAPKHTKDRNPGQSTIWFQPREHYEITSPISWAGFMVFDEPHGSWLQAPHILACGFEAATASPAIDFQGKIDVSCEAGAACRRLKGSIDAAP